MLMGIPRGLQELVRSPNAKIGAKTCGYCGHVLREHVTRVVPRKRPIRTLFQCHVCSAEGRHVCVAVRHPGA